MTRLAWNPLWYSTGASLWTIASKIAFVRTSTVAAVAEELVGATPCGRLPLWCPTPTDAAAACEMLNLPASRRTALFVGHQPLQTAQREQLRLSLRWCPQCLRDGFHSPHFQDTRVACCPWHLCELLESCPKCHRAVDPLGLEPWKCAACLLPLGLDTEDWLQPFKRRPEHGGRWPTKAVRHASLDENAWLCPQPEVRQSSLRAHLHGAIAEHAEHVQAFEEASALWDTLLVDHRDCLGREPHGWVPQFHSVEFNCPVAAAASHAFHYAGAVQEPLGNWQTFPSAVGREHGVKLPSYFPACTRPYLIRATVRHWLENALLQFADVAGVGRRTTHWRPPVRFTAANVDTQQGSSGPYTVTSAVTLKALIEAHDYAAERCPLRR